MFMATHPAIYWATVHPAVVLGNKLGQDPIHERFGEPECTYDSVPSYYFERTRALAAQAAVGMKQLDRIQALNGSRRKMVRRLTEASSAQQIWIFPNIPRAQSRST